MRIDHIDSVGTGSNYDPSIQHVAQVRGATQAGDPPPTTLPTRAELEERMKALEQAQGNLRGPLAPWISEWHVRLVGLPRSLRAVWKETVPGKPGLPAELISRRRAELIKSFMDEYIEKNKPLPLVGSPGYDAYMERMETYERTLAADPNVNAVANNPSIDGRQHTDNHYAH